MTTTSRIWLVTGSWLAVVVALVGSSVLVGASLTASALVFAGCLAPAAIMVLLGFGAPSPPVKDWLHVVERNARTD
jgi:hypothetical protein